MIKWVPVFGFEKYYEVSNTGVIRRIGKSRGSVFHNILTQTLNNSGYLRVRISRVGIRKNIYVHKIVAESFLGPRPNGLFVNHIDCNKTNNNIENLEYVTRKENMNHARKCGYNFNAKKIICLNNGKQFESISEAGRSLGISSKEINNVVGRDNCSAHGYRFIYAPTGE